LQTQKHTRRFQNRCFAFAVGTNEKIETGGEFEAQRFEAAKIPELEIGQHRSSLLYRFLSSRANASDLATNNGARDNS
jgi:hypothetical protein